MGLLLLLLGISVLTREDAGGTGRLRSNGEGDDNDEPTDDETALARMMHSESDNPDVQVVVGWMAMEAARRRGVSVFQRLTGRSGKYGPQVLEGAVRYASTRKKTTPETRRLAQDLLAGRVLPARAIRRWGLSAWVEKGVSGYTAQKLLDNQYGPEGQAGGKTDDGYGGIFARVAGTRWYLYNPRAPLLRYDPDDPSSPEAVLATVPDVPAVDSRPAVS